MKKLSTIISLFISCFFIYPSVAQDCFYKVEGYSSGSFGDYTPFWNTSNNFGLTPIKNGGSYLMIGGQYEFFGSKAIKLQVGADFVAATKHSSDFYIHQLYVNAQYKKINLSIGPRKHTSITSNNDIGTGSFLLSSNARPLPEIYLGVDFFSLPFTFNILKVKGEATIGTMYDNNYNEQVIKKNGNKYHTWDVLTHSKSLFVKLEDPRNLFPFALTAGIEHSVMWGGKTTYPEGGEPFGKLPSGFKDFIRVFFGMNGGSNSMVTDQRNALGASTGTFNSRLDYKSSFADISVYWSHIFTDGSGMNYKNWFRDGLLGIEVNPHTLRFVETFLYEYMNTTFQSGALHFIEPGSPNYSANGSDNHYNNGVYTQGYSYFGRSMGNPLLTSPEYFGLLGFINNRVKAHHLGVKGNITPQLNYMVRMTVSRNWGTMGTPFIEMKQNFSAGIKMGYHFSKKLEGMEATASLAGDCGTLIGKNFGMSVGISYTGLFEKK